MVRRQLSTCISETFFLAALEKLLKVHAAGGATLKAFAPWFWDSRGAKV